MNILITGATGFIGRELIKKFDKKELTILSRTYIEEYKNINHPLEDFINKKCINSKFDVAIHLAGLAHGTFSDSILTSNFKSTMALAEQLAINGMKRFIFLSSIGVNGGVTSGTPFSEQSLPKPHTKYSLCKYNIEIALQDLAKELNFELVIIRSPLVYGINAPGNFGRVFNLISKGIPLPFGMIKNSKSFISVSNLSDFIKLAVKHPNVSNELFLVSDDNPISTKDMVLDIWKAKGIKSFLLPIPSFLLRLVLFLIGQTPMSVQLIDDLEIDNGKAKKLTGWTPKENFFEYFKNSL